MSSTTKRILSLVAWGSFAALVFVVLMPTLSAPVEADDRYWYLTVPGTARGSYASIVDSTLTEIASTLDHGRIAPLAFAARRFLAQATVQVAMATTAPIAVIHGVTKVLLLGVSLASIFAYLRSLRWRSDSGAAVSLSSETMRWLLVAFLPLLAVGSQTQAPFRNAWVAYPILTYGAVIIIFGGLALILWAARAILDRDGFHALPLLIAVALIGAALNFTYELYFVVVLIVPVVLWTTPLGPDPIREKRARGLIALTFVGSFLAVFGATRVVIAAHCADVDCYVGTDLSIGPSAVSTAWINLATAVPVFGHDELLAQIADAGLPSDWSGPVSSTLGLVGPLLAGAVIALLLWRTLSSTRDPLPESMRRGEASALTRAALVAAAVAVSTAVVMALSTQSQEIITSLGQPYRNTMVTWTALALTISLAARAGTVRYAKRRASVGAAIVVGSIIAVLGTIGLPRNAEAVRAHRSTPAVMVIEQIHWEVVLGDPSIDGDTRRCELYAVAEETIFTQWIGSSMKQGAQRAFDYFHQRPYCSSWPEDV